MTEDRQPALALLRERGAHLIRHSADMTLLDHLVAVARILDGWGAAEHVVLAGLFHSVYGTEFFRSPPLAASDRGHVRAVIGEAAERLAWLFCIFDRRAFLADAARGVPPRVRSAFGAADEAITDAEARALAVLLAANTLDQERTSRASDTAAMVAAIGVEALLPAVARDGIVREAGAWLDRLFGARANDVAARANHHVLADGDPSRLGRMAHATLEAFLSCPRRSTTGYLRRLDGTIATLTPRANQVVLLHARGAGIMLGDVTSPDTIRCKRGLEDELGLFGDTAVVSVLSTRTALGIARYDAHDNIAIQLHGRRRWRVGANEAVVDPIEPYVAGAPLGPMQRAVGQTQSAPGRTEEIELQPGSVLWLPRGTWHELCSVEEGPSLYLNFRLLRPTARDGVLCALESASDLRTAPELRRALVRGGGSGWSEPAYRAAFDGLMAMAEGSPNDEAIAERWRVRSRTR